MTDRIPRCEKCGQPFDGMVNRQCGGTIHIECPPPGGFPPPETLTRADHDRMVREAVEKERERCARIAEDAGKPAAKAYTRKRMGLPHLAISKPLAIQAIRIAAAIREVKL